MPFIWIQLQKYSKHKKSSPPSPAPKHINHNSEAQLPQHTFWNISNEKRKQESKNKDEKLEHTSSAAKMTLILL